MGQANWDSLSQVLPTVLQQAVIMCPAQTKQTAEEIRLRAGQPPTVVADGKEQTLFLTPGRFEVNQMCFQTILDRATQHSAYAADTLRSGFLTIEGGHRIGLCGTVVMEGNHVRTMKEITSMNIRIAREMKGIGIKPADAFAARKGNWLLAGPPGSGKTTMLRDMIRQISKKYSKRIGVVDQRQEIAAVYHGLPQFDLGSTTDVLSGCPKAWGIETLLRVMGPEIIAVDEISAMEDAETMERASYCGVILLATAHASSLDELNRRPIYRRLLDMHLFSTVLLLSPDKTYRMIALADA